jgi:hypothetical protein
MIPVLLMLGEKGGAVFSEIFASKSSLVYEILYTIDPVRKMIASIV